MSEIAKPANKPVGVRVTPEPTDGELAAILAAYDELWPATSEVATPGEPPRWRFSGRWWAPRPRYGGWT